MSSLGGEVFRRSTLLLAVGLALCVLYPWAVEAADATEADSLGAKLEAARARFPALLVEGEAAPVPDVVVVDGLPEGAEGPAALGSWHEGTMLHRGEPREVGPKIVSLVSEVGPTAGEPSPARRMAVARRTARGAPPHEAMVIALPAEAPGREVVELDLDPRASRFEVWRVEDGGALTELLSSDRPWGGRSLDLEAEPGGLYVVTLSYPWE
jgi:hypothetical protein